MYARSTRHRNARASVRVAWTLLASTVLVLGLPLASIAGARKAPARGLGSGAAHAPLAARKPSGVPRAAGALTGEESFGKVRGSDVIDLSFDGYTGQGLSAGVIYSSAKVAWGNRFTLQAGQRPFTLTTVSAVFFGGFDANGDDVVDGLAVGDAVRILILADASGSGDPANAVLVYGEDVVVKGLSDVGFSEYTLNNPVTVSQGDVYIVFVDRSTDEGGTLLFWVDAEAGGVPASRSFLTTNTQLRTGT
jgi:hypothetical protein